MAHTPMIDGISVVFSTTLIKIEELSTIFGSFHLKRKPSSLDSRPQFQVQPKDPCSVFVALKVRSSTVDRCLGHGKMQPLGGTPGRSMCD